MADKTLKYEIEMDASGAIKSMKQFRDEADKSGESTKKAGISLDSMAVKAAAVGASFLAMKQALQSFEQTAGIINRFNGDISEASRRTNGLISDIELMTAANKAAEAGLKLNASQFADLAVKASEYAAATGRDAVQATEELTLALASGEREGLKRFGLAVTGVQGNVATTEAALKKLTDEVGNMESSADTAAGSILTLGNHLSNLNTEFVKGVQFASEFEKRTGQMSSATTELKDIVFAITETFGDLGVTIGVVADSMGIYFDAVGEFLSDPFGGGFDKAMQKLDVFNERLQRALDGRRSLSANQMRGEPTGLGSESAVSSASGGASGAGRGGRSSRRRGAQEEVTPSIYNGVGYRSTGASGPGLAENQRFAGELGALGARTGAEQISDAASNVDDLTTAFRELFATQSDAETFAAGVKGAFDTVQGSIASTINDAVAAKKSISEAFEALAINLIKSLGEYLVNDGIKNILTGTVQLIDLDPRGAAKIGIGVAEVAAGVGMGAAAASLAPPPAGGGASATSQPQEPPSNQSQQREPDIYVVQFTAPTPKERIGADTDSALRAARRRNGNARTRAIGS